MKQRRSTFFLLLIVWTVFGLLTPQVGVRAQDVDEVRARKVMAAYLYNFAKFIHWPEKSLPEERRPFVVGVLGNDPFGRILDDTVKGKHIGQHPIKVKRFDWNLEADHKAIKGCHMIYISASEHYRTHEILTALESHPVLLVSDMADFAENGGMIGFVLEKGRLVFEINSVALEQAELKASSKLLKLARIVKSKKR